MKRLLLPLCLLGFLPHVLLECSLSAPEFKLKGDHLLGGLFDVHDVRSSTVQYRPVAIDCSRHKFSLSKYRQFQLMKFVIEEINNSTTLLPNVSLGYELFDHCSDVLNFPAVLKLISDNGLIRPHRTPNGSKIIGVIGPMGSSEAITVAPFFMMNLIPMVNFAASSSKLSSKEKYPSFHRTAPSNKDNIELIVRILLKFDWRWVAFVKSDNAYGNDGLELFKEQINGTNICLASAQALSDDTNYTATLNDIELLRVAIIIVFASERYVVDLIHAAISLNISKKVWIAGDTWAKNTHLSQDTQGIEKIGTVLGITESEVAIPAFDNFINSYKYKKTCAADAGQNMFCNQICNCSSVRPQEIIAADPSYSFFIYSAVYSLAHALHNVLQCGDGKCRSNFTVYPYMVLAKLKKTNFTLLNRSIQFDINGDPMHKDYSIVFWNSSGQLEKVGFFETNPVVLLYINDTAIEWHTTKGTVPEALCSCECGPGYAKVQEGIHKCCFHCEICPNGSYVNTTENAYKCIKCKETEWSNPGSTFCILRSVEYVPLSDTSAILIMFATGVLVCLSTAMAILFAINYNTPIVKSAGGPMCFLVLGCLNVSSISVFFYFDKPTIAACILRYLPFLLFYTPCLACFVVRSFQIVCVFKMAAKFPKFNSWWIRYNGQWLVITGAFVAQAFVLLAQYAADTPKPYNETYWYKDKIILACDLGHGGGLYIALLLLGSLCFFCFVFSYMGKDLPKNYNEAKAITFCLILLILTWITFATEYVLYRGKYIQTLNAAAVLSSLYCILLWYFLPKCYIIIFQPQKNTQQYFQGLIQSYTKTISM